MTNQFRNQFYAVIKQHRSLSQREGRPLTTITMWGLDDKQTYTSYIVEGYKNSEFWSYIVNHPNRGFLVRFPTGRLTKDRIINADSLPAIEDTFESADLLRNRVVEAWASTPGATQKKKKPTTAEVLAQAEKFIEMARELYTDSE